MEAFLTLMAAWLIVFLAARKGDKRHGMSQYEKDRIRRSNKRFIEEEMQRYRKLKRALYDFLWGTNKNF